MKHGLCTHEILVNVGIYRDICFQPNIYIITFLVLFLGISLDVVLLIDLFMTLYKMYLIHPLWF